MTKGFRAALCASLAALVLVGLTWMRTGSAQALRVEVEGELEVFYEDDEQASRLLVFLKTARGERPALHFNGQSPPQFLTGMHARVRGVKSGQDLAVEADGATVTTTSTTGSTTTILPRTFGEQ